MKFIIVGLHCSGKQEVMDTLSKDGINCGRLFTNADLADDRYDFFTDDDIRSIFENNAYIFIRDVAYNSNCYEGLSFYEFDNKDVFALTPDQFISIPNVPLKDEVCIVWLDANKASRYNRYKLEKRSYNWNEEEALETRDMAEFVKYIYNFPNSHMLYFNNEDPQRVAGIVYALVKYPDLLPILEKKFN